ncbi:Permease of the drug/metabolite transporter (DMT) superfamily [Lachnospiraceae bacterium NE2001]|nr:Permease of the drug/metabolite transporter (DMT) superfamily [Lachnospiraceae bacterium NE2001]
MKENEKVNITVKEVHRGSDKMTGKNSGNLRGILHIVLAAFSFSLMTLFLKLAGELPTMEKAFFRNFVALFLALLLLARSEEKFKIKKETFPSVLLRCMFGTAGLIANFWAIDRLGLADSNMLNKMSPFFAIIMSVFILKEKPDVFEWLMVVMAFVGVIFIVKPGMGLASIPALVGLFGGFGAGTAYTFLRKATSAGERGTIVVMCFSLFSCLVTLPFLIINFEPMTTKQLIFMLLAGVGAMGGQVNITAAYSFAPAKEISVYDYAQVIFAAIWGIWIFDEIPDILSVLGYVIIISAGVIRWRYTLHKSSGEDSK